MIRSAYQPHREDDDFGQPGTMYREVLDDDARSRLVSNIVGHATNAVSGPVQERVIEYWTNVDSDLGSRVADGIRGAGSNGAGAANAPHGEEPIGSSASTGL